MDNFRNKQSSGGSFGGNNSVDGFSRPRHGARPRPPGVPGGLGASRPQRPARLDDFTGSDGFTTRSSQRTVKAARPPAFDEEPVLISRHPPPNYKRGFFGLGRKKLRGAAPKSRKPWSRRKKITVGIISLFVILGLIFGFLVVKGYLNLFGGGGGAAALEKNVDPSKLKGEGDGRVNILMLGKGGDGYEGADLMDTVILASIDPIQKEAALVSVPRDLYVPVSGQGSMKLNAVYAAGKSASLSKSRKQNNDARKQAEEAGYKLMEETVEKTLGVPVHYRTIIDFQGFKQAVDTVGGVDINAPTAVKETMRIDGKTYNLDIKPGQQKMDGFKALAYARSRYTSARGDFDRSERQRLILIALKEKVTSAGTYSNPVKIAGLLDNLGDRVSTNFNSQDLSRLYELGREIGSNKISSIGLADPPNNYVTTSNMDGQSVVIPRAGAGNYKEIQSYLRNVLKDSFIRNENASIAVLNGTNTPGLAATKADELKSYGYNITVVANAPTKNYPKTIIVDLRSGSKRYTKNYLEKRFGVLTTGAMPDAGIQPGTADFVIILGNDQSR